MTRFGLSLLLVLGAGGAAQGDAVELGAVAWRRDYDAAKTEAKKSKRPLLILFDEVPG